MRSCSFWKSKIYTLVVETHQNQPTLYDEIHQILGSPIVTEVQIAHWQWIASYYMCAMRIGCYAKSLLLESETVISLKNRCFVDESTLSDDEF
jgi:primosomal protein N' (replication factor Y)